MVETAAQMGAIVSRTDLDKHCARALHRLDCVQEQIQKHLVKGHPEKTQDARYLHVRRFRS